MIAVGGQAVRGPLVQRGPVGRGVARAAARSARAARAVLDQLDRLDDRALPVVRRVLDAVAVRAMHLRAGLPARAGAPARTRDMVVPLWARSDRPVPAGAGDSDGDGDALAGQVAAQPARACPDDAGTAAWVGGARRVASRLALERTARIMTLGAVGVIGVSAVAALWRGPAGGRVDVATDSVRTSLRPAESTDGYLAAAQARLAVLALAPEQPDIYAAVSFPGYRTPEQTRALLGDFRTVRVFFRVPPDGPILTTDVGDPARDIPAAFTRAAESAAYRVGTAADAVTRERAEDEAVALSGSCACLYGAVVRAPADQLALLAAMASVRLVDTAPPGTSAPAPTLVPLRPEQR
ncbi:hypothetical protein [Frankia sp. Cj5]|uniref:hypothetical protein n=1 Tax=Frankia sp. Cj5 TaxID=2880978 RepID=UPI001EF65372|nr:hypothetical protein [Frankia sp. Cj5]